MSSFFVSEKRISRSVRIVWLRKIRNARIYSPFIAQVSDLNCTFALSEGRNPRFKNAFLALSRITKSAKLRRGVRTMQRSFCLYIHKVQPCCTPRYIRQRGVFVSQFISTMAFADASYTMSATSLYAFLVSIIKHKLLTLISRDL